MNATITAWIWLALTFLALIFGLRDAAFVAALVSAQIWAATTYLEERR